MKKERFLIEKVEKQKTGGFVWVSLLINDTKKAHKFWIDCSLVDEYGGHVAEYTNGIDLGIDWEFNKYIFSDYSDADQVAKEYQESGNNCDDIAYFADYHSGEILTYFK